MILMRISKVLGVCQINPYNENAYKDGGWFPIESVGLGVAPGGHSSENTGPGPSSSPTAPPTGTGGDGPSESSEITVSKNVDFSTVNLMQLAMESGHDKGKGNEIAVEADIHFVGTVDVDGKLFTSTSLRIHLEGVHVKSWRIEGSGNGRPTENISVIFEKIALCYEGVGKDKKNFKPMAGWDQTEGKRWDSPITHFYPDFPKTS